MEYRTKIGVFGGEIDPSTKDLNIYFNEKYLFTVYIKKEGIHPMDADAVARVIETRVPHCPKAVKEPTVKELRKEIVTALSKVQELKPETRRRLASLTSQVDNVLRAVE